MSEIKYQIIGSGDHRLFRNITIPLAEEIDSSIDDLVLHDSADGALFSADSRPMALDSSTVLLGIAFAFPSWLAVKVLDVVFDLKIKPIVAGVIKKLDGIDIFPKKQIHKTFLIPIHYTDFDKAVAVAIKEKDIQNIILHLDQVKPIHQAALDNIDKEKRSKVIHLYVVTNGIVNPEPVICLSFEELMEKLKS